MTTKVKVLKKYLVGLFGVYTHLHHGKMELILNSVGACVLYALLPVNTLSWRRTAINMHIAFSIQ